ncbi:MAG: hypothetical protein WBC92_19680 [Terracidiphilus sp.]
MGFVPVMWTLFGAAFLFMAAASIYSARLAKNEEDQLFLADSSNRAKSEQSAIADRVEKFQPVKRAAVVLVGAMALLVVGYYILDMIRQFK